MQQRKLIGNLIILTLWFIVLYILFTPKPHTNSLVCNGKTILENQHYISELPDFGNLYRVQEFQSGLLKIYTPEPNSICHITEERK